MKIRLDAYYLFLEKTGIAKGMSSEHVLCGDSYAHIFKS